MPYNVPIGMDGEIVGEWGIKEKSKSSKKTSAGQTEKHDR